MDIKISFRKIIALTILTSVTLVFSRCKKDSLEETSINSPLTLGGPDEIKSETLSATGITSSSYYLVNSLPSGYVKDGSRDYTSYVQAAVTKYSNIVFPGFPILVNDKGITVGSNKTITFEEGSEIRLKGTSSNSYAIFRVSNVSNVTFYNPVIVGDRNTHIGTSGEHGMGIGIWGSSDISIYNARITNCWGDGIYIGQAGDRINCKNIIIKDAYLRKNRRDGISVIGVDGLLIENLYAGFSDGTSPMSGINFEPNNALNEIKNVRINNVRTESNGGNGIQIGLSNLLTGTTDKQVDITVVNHVDIGSPKNAFKVRANNSDGTGAKISGLINVVNPSWQKTASDLPLGLSSANQLGLKTTISSPEVVNSGGRLLSYTETAALLIKQARFANLSVTNVGENLTTITQPAETDLNIVFAVNAGGSEFKASNGITYSSDKNFSKGSLYKSTSAISNTADDVLYQSERFGNFSYSIPVANGTYEITFKMAELYHKTSLKRKFDILAENSEIVSNLDIFSAAGANNKYDVVKSISVTDGVLNLSFRTDVDNAKISAFHVIKK